MSRPNGLEAQNRRNVFADLVADDFRSGGLAEAHRNVVEHAKQARLDPWRALKLSYEPSFVAQVARLAGIGDRP